MTGELTNERVWGVVLTGAHPQPVVFNAALERKKKESGLISVSHILKEKSASFHAHLWCKNASTNAVTVQTGLDLQPLLFADILSNQVQMLNKPLSKVQATFYTVWDSLAPHQV